MKRLTADEIEREIAALDDLDIKALQQRWRELFKIEPPFKIRSGFLRRAIAYRLQEIVHGGLRADTKRQLRRIADELRQRRGLSIWAVGSSIDQPARALSRRPTLSPGTRLLREWNGSMEAVEVIRDGFVWRGKTYRTLSAVAVAITGTKWSGPKFFGLTGKPRASPQRAARQEPAPALEEAL